MTTSCGGGHAILSKRNPRQTTMSLDYVRRNRQILASEVLQRDIFVDELGDLTDGDLNRLVAEAEITVKCLQEDHDALSDGDINRVHVRHKRNVWKTYRQAALIEQRLRGIDNAEKFYSLVAERIGIEEAKALMNAAKG
jgi:hypothetical protein